MRVVKLTASLVVVVFFLGLGAVQAGALTFTPPAHYQAGGHPGDLAGVDLNGDRLRSRLPRASSRLLKKRASEER